MWTTMGDGELLTHVAAQQEGALQELYTRHTAALSRFAVHAGAEDDAEDCIQDVWIRVWRNADTFHATHAYRDRAAMAWLYTIVRRTALDRARQRSRQLRHTQELERAVGDTLLTSSAMDDAVIAQTTHRDALRLLGTVLTPAQAHIVDLRYAQDLPHETIATILGIKPATVRSTLFRALAAMRERAGAAPDMYESVASSVPYAYA